MSTYSIYLAYCTKSNKYYVGQTKQTLLKRWSRHCSDARNGAKSHFCNAIRKYGVAAFELHILVGDVETKKAADYFERLWILSLDSRNSEIGYNTTRGGDDPFNHTGVRRSEESKRKYRESKLGAKNPRFGKHNKNTFQVGSMNPNFGRPHPPEVIEKMREAQKERWRRKRV
jgi:group I intron endonuclease